MKKYAAVVLGTVTSAALLMGCVRSSDSSAGTSEPQTEEASSEAASESVSEAAEDLPKAVDDLQKVLEDTGTEVGAAADLPQGTTEQNQALKSATQYLSHTAFSHDGLIGQLEYEGFSTEDATWAADNCGADWMEQALKAATQYLDHQAFSQSGLANQLEYEKYTPEQAKYGAENCGADWMEQAVKCAQSYMDMGGLPVAGNTMSLMKRSCSACLLRVSPANTLPPALLYFSMDSATCGAVLPFTSFFRFPTPQL